MVIIVGSIIALLVFGINKIIKIGRTRVNQEDLLDEIDNLNNQVNRLMKEKQDIMAMKVSKLGLNPEDEEELEEMLEGEEGEIDASGSRFPKLTVIDQEYRDYKVKTYANNYTLAEIADNFRAFNASQLKLYYDMPLIRSFIAGLSCGKLIILQGILVQVKHHLHMHGVSLLTMIHALPQ